MENIDDIIIEPEHSENQSLRSKIIDLVENYDGTFTGKNIDDELGLSPDERKRRSEYLSRLYKSGYLIRVKPNTYEKNKITLERISILNTNIDCFDINLPLGLGDLVQMPKKSIAVIAGTTNSGKTQFLLELLKQNIKKDYRKMYLMSEMGGGEYARRVIKTCNSDKEQISEWDKSVFSAEKTSGFGTAIKTYCADGLAIIDFLEIKGEFYEVGKNIARIYEDIGDGLTFIALQKKTGSDFGRGGEMTAEKARLYLSMEKVIEGENSTLSYLKIIKAKEYSGRNPNGMEIHLSVSNSGIEILSDWSRVDDSDRIAIFNKYNSESTGDRLVRMADAVPYEEKVIQIKQRENFTSSLYDTAPR